MKQPIIPHIGMRIVKTAVAVMLAYSIFAVLDLVYRKDYQGIWGMLGPNYACIACIVCTQSTLGQTLRQGVSRLIGVAVGGTLGVLVLLLGPVLDMPWVKALAASLAVLLLALAAAVGFRRRGFR